MVQSGLPTGQITRNALIKARERRGTERVALSELREIEGMPIAFDE